MKGNRLYKAEKLCSRTAINSLFSGGKSEISYPLRAVTKISDAAEGDAAPAKFLITIPKRKIRTAVGRVLLRRRVREAYRLNRSLLYPALEAVGKKVDLAIIYLDTKPANYATIERCVKNLFGKIVANIEK